MPNANIARTSSEASISSVGPLRTRSWIVAPQPNAMTASAAPRMSVRAGNVSRRRRAARRRAGRA